MPGHAFKKQPSRLTLATNGLLRPSAGSHNPPEIRRQVDLAVSDAGRRGAANRPLDEPLRKACYAAGGVSERTPSESEALILTRLRAGDRRGAVEVTVQQLGPEVHGFIVAMMRDADLGQEAFSIFCEDVWRGLPDFKWNSSLRTWLYAVARNACHRARRNKARARLLLNDAEFTSLEAELRSQTATYLRTEVKDAVRDLRAQLSEEEQELLILRVDRDMSWTEIAEVKLNLEAADEELVKREASTCRKRFERTRQRLKKLALEQGLLKPKD